GIEIVAVKCGQKRLALGAPCTFELRFSDAFRNTAPMGGALRQIEVVRDGCEPLAARPAHRGRMRVHARAPSVFPDARIRLERELRCLLTKRLDGVKKRCISRPRSSRIARHW